ncbi:MAG: hypothetical protein CMF49_09850 [Legionellales bacterium]|nr:hypothetical protein [Legionellales bacterium]|tara:strand:+ start:3640 stop:4014 length:375 start_codon:yes stop_codon:yes gene_type:complete
MEKSRILLVEDLKIAQKAAKKILSHFDFIVDMATTGQEAIDAFHKNEYQLIFMDVGLPDMHGLSVVAKIREYEEGRGRRALIIALSAHATEEYQDAAFEYGMDDFIAKPLTKKKVQLIIDKYLT